MPEPDQRIEMIGLNRPRNPIVMMITVNVYMIRFTRRQCSSESTGDGNDDDNGENFHRKRV